MDPYSSSSQYSPYSTSSQYSSSSPSIVGGSGYTPFSPSQHYSHEAGGSSDQMYHAPYDSYYPSAPAGYIVDPTGTVPFTYPGVTTSNAPLDSTSRHSILLSPIEWQQSCGPLPPGSVVARHSISSYPPPRPTQRPSPTPPRHPSPTSQSSDTEVPAEEITETEPASNKRKKTEDSSWVWHFFEKLLDPNGNRSARCLACKKVYKFGKNCGTGSLSRHLKNKHVDLLDGGKGKTQSQIVGGTGGLSTFRYKPELAKENLAKFIVQAELPFNITENEFFEKYIKSSFCPEYQKISRRTITREIERLFCAKKLSCKLLYLL